MTVTVTVTVTGLIVHPPLSHYTVPYDQVRMTGRALVLHEKEDQLPHRTGLLSFMDWVLIN